jgi:subtilisin family serine protease
MKKFMLFTLMTLFCMTLFAEKVYRSDGTFFEMKRSGDVFALKVDAASLKAPENYKMKWVSGDEFIVIDKHQKGNLPVYLVGMNIVVADSVFFYQGAKPVEFIEKKYGVKATEILNGYNLVEFSGAADSVKTAQQIVENGDGFAFPNLYRRYELKAVNPVKFPIKDKFYTENYQWSLKNTGEAIGVYGDKVSTLKHADVKFEEAMEFIYNQIEEEKLAGFDEKTKVAIMDSGVDFEHPDLKNKLEDGFNMVHPGETGNPGKYDPTDPQNQMYGSAGYSHGTNCAGVSAAEGNEIGTVGICPWCGIYPVTYMEGGMGTQESSSDKKLMEVYTKYAEDPEIVAINCSFGPMAGFGDIPASQGEINSHKKFMEEGRKGKGGVIVYASGNDGVDASYTGILTYEFKLKRGEDCSFEEGVEDGENCEEVKSSVVTVGASSGWDTRVTYSNYGDMLDIVTPSLSMRPTLGIATSYLTGYGDLTDEDGKKDYTNQFSGTSSSAPVITGAFGVIFSVNPELTLEEAIDILHKSADKVNPETGFYDENGHSIKYGYGRLNLLKAVRLAMGLDMCDGSAAETADNLDNNCDGKVDEGFNKDISKVTAKCKEDKDCESADFKGSDVKCLTGNIGKYNFKDGYCVVKNNSFACPDGTAPTDDYGTDCLLECNDNNPCPKGFACTDKKLGLCYPECSEDKDCSENAYCDTKTKLCRNNPSEPMGPCETTEDCKYNAMMCLTEMPDGICLVMCRDDDNACNDEENGPNKCAEVNFQGYKMNLCLPGCEDDSQCRSFGYGYSMKCHKLYNGKTNICGMPCGEDADCVDPDDAAKCVDSRCVSVNDPDETDTAADTEPDDGDAADTADEEPADDSDDMNLDDDQPKKKKSSGCSVTTL